MGMILVCCGIFLLILDPQSAVSGAQEGLELCIGAVVPSLFPFFFLSVLLTSSLAGKKFRWLRPLGKLLHLPAGSEAILLIGLIGGYPVGAQAVSQAWESERLDQENARRMLAFCNNAGPSFLFGILGRMFSSAIVPWVLWAVHILSALLVGFLLPPAKQNSMTRSSAKPLTVAGALERAVKIMANVCGWVILFRVMISFLNRWMLWVLPETVQYSLIGVLELTNGCAALSNVTCEGLRFVLAACFLAFGGVCVGMQTASVTGKLGTGYYFPGKFMQLVFSFLMACIVQYFIFPSQSRVMVPPVVIYTMLLTGILTVLLLKKRKNNSSIPALSGV